MRIRNQERSHPDFFRGRGGRSKLWRGKVYADENNGIKCL